MMNFPIYKEQSPKEDYEKSFIGQIKYSVGNVVQIKPLGGL